MNGFFSSDFVKITIPLLGGALAWFLNQHRKRAWEDYLRKERHYAALIRAVKGFYEGATNNPALKEEFLEQLNLCWLYAPDEVIRRGYAFLENVQTDARVENDGKRRALGDFMVAIRRDLIAREPLESTSLQAHDFRLLTVIRPPT